MTRPHSNDSHTDTDRWRQILSAPTALTVVAAEVDDWSLVTAHHAEWLTRAELPVGWEPIVAPENPSMPLRIVALAMDDLPGLAACQSLTAFRFTGVPPVDLLYENADRALQAFSAQGIHTDAVVLPERTGLAAVHSDGHIALGDNHFWVRYSTYLQGSREPQDGLIVEEIAVVAADLYLRLGKDIGTLSQATKQAFLDRVGVTTSDIERAVHAHAEQMRAQVAQGPQLHDQQRRFLATALAMFGGVAPLRPLPPTLLGYTDQPAFDDAITRYQDELSISSAPPFSSLDWTRILLLAEISYGSNLLGAGIDFEIVTAWRDHEALTLLRSIQRALAPFVDVSLLGPTGRQGLGASTT